ncbi:MAG: cob(I)yrinic acid a,c-diamide adenosyltransferase [Bacteroidales bacterium]|nr:cob(I)yrinic acid a,c-diamide adenosyltransferase [Bacteroidales bacterium]
MRIYTKTGDKGKTSVFGGMVCSKDDIRVECNGKVDEVTSLIGLLRAKLTTEHPWDQKLHRIQIDLMDMMSHIATHSSMRDKNNVNRPVEGPKFCEDWIDSMLEEIPEPHDWFILPGGNEISAQCQVIRATMRTAERRLISLHKEDAVEDYILKYINRLSDVFFVMARYELFKAGFGEEKLRPFRTRTNKTG